MNQKNFYQISKKIRRIVLEMIYQSKSSHIGSAFSIIEILIALYFKILRIQPKNPFWKDRDRFILSKGHAVSALYAVLAERGFFDKKILDSYQKNNSSLPSHPIFLSIPGIEFSTGSLGHGLPVGVGLALSAQRKNKKFRVFVLLSDGECQEGSTWEAVLFASHHKLDNLIAIIDYNKWQAFGRTNEVLSIEPLAKKWQDFGWAVKEVDGHNFEAIFNAFQKIPFTKNKPSVLIAHTIKGKGLYYMEDRIESHYKPPSDEEYKKIIETLK